MSPRAYRLGRRQEATDETRARILAAARALLADATAVGGFSVDAVARQAGVARMTVYYQFGSKRGLVAALFDDLATRGGMQHLAGAFHQPDPLDALAAYVATFVGFWASDRLVHRRIQALAALDPEVEQEVRARHEWGRGGARTILRRIAEQHGHPVPERLEEAADVLFALVSFPTFDTLAESGRPPEQIAATLQRLALAALELPDP